MATETYYCTCETCNATFPTMAEATECESSHQHPEICGTSFNRAQALPWRIIVRAPSGRCYGYDLCANTPEGARIQGYEAEGVA